MKIFGRRAIHSEIVPLGQALVFDASGNDRAGGAPANEDVLSRCRQGDTEAWRAFFASHFLFVRRIARRLGTAASDLDDVCQDVFIVAFRKIEAFGHGQVTTWLYRIVANVVSSYHRRRRVRAVFAQLGWGATAAPDPVLSPERLLETRQAERVVADILARMTPKKREVFSLFELEGLSGKEIAQFVGCPVETVFTRLFHARRDFVRLAQKKGLL